MVQAYHHDLLEKIYEYPLILPSKAVQRAMTLADTTRLEKFARKLLKGEQKQIVILSQVRIRKPQAFSMSHGE